MVENEGDGTASKLKRGTGVVRRRVDPESGDLVHACYV
jgi:hypothetical protein